jgi:NAD(P)H-dependent FMN reductase
MGNDCLKSGPPKYKIAVICGSLRQKSCNRGLLQALIDTKHPQFDFIWVDIMNFPIFD